MKHLLLALSLFLFSASIFAQDLPEEKLKKKLKADILEMDGGNGDGVFRARNKKTQKWGLYQYTYSGTEVEVLIPPAYDSLRFIPFNGNFTVVYLGGKAGIYLSKWTYGDDAKQTVECLYEDYQRFSVENGMTYLAMKKNGQWGWVNWYTGEEKSEFKYADKDDLPYPYFKQEY